MPIIPEINVNRARRSSHEHKDIDAKANRNYERADRARIRNSRRRRPAEIEEREIQVIEVGHPLQGRAEIRGEKRSHYAQANEADADEKP